MPAARHVWPLATEERLNPIDSGTGVVIEFGERRAQRQRATVELIEHSLSPGLAVLLERLNRLQAAMESLDGDAATSDMDRLALAAAGSRISVAVAELSQVLAKSVGPRDQGPGGEIS